MQMRLNLEQNLMEIILHKTNSLVTAPFRYYFLPLVKFFSVVQKALLVRVHGITKNK